MHTNHLSAYVDGSYRNGVSGYGIVAFSSSDTFYIYGGFKSKAITWQMSSEFRAVMRALSFAIENEFESITLFYDCSGVEYWSRREVAKLTLDKHPLYLEYNSFIKRASKKIKINFVKVEAHSGIVHNEYADKLAKYGLRSLKSEFSFDMTTQKYPIKPSKQKYRNRFLYKQLVNNTSAKSPKEEHVLTHC